MKTSSDADRRILAIRIAGEAVPQPRPRLAKRGRRTVAISVPKGSAVDTLRNSIAVLARAYLGRVAPFDGPAELRVLLVFARNQADQKRRSPRAWETRKTCGDFDNLAKPIADALNGIAIRDDSQIARAIVEKIAAGPGEDPRLEIELLELRGVPDVRSFSSRSRDSRP